MDSSAANRDRIREKLERHGVIPTSQRMDVAAVLLEKPCHMSAENLLQALRRNGARVSKATVYNTLNLFAERGLVQAVTVDPTRTYYDSTTAPHHHFYNEDTGELIDIPPEAVEIRDLPHAPAGTRSVGVHVVVRVRTEARPATDAAPAAARPLAVKEEPEG